MANAKIIDFLESARRLKRTRKIEEGAKAITQVEHRRPVSRDRIEKALQEHPELECLREKGIETHHIAAWLETYPAVKLEELIGILQLAVEKMKSGESERIIEYLFQPLYPDWNKPDIPSPRKGID